jgi:hypothetical protein
LEKICNSIDLEILKALPNAGLKAYGLCELIKKGDQQNPVTVDSTRKIASFVDSMNGHFYHRLLNSNQNEDEDMSFGDELIIKTAARIRTVLAYKIKLGEEFIFDFINAIPQKTKMDGYKFIHRSVAIDLIVDHEGVYNQEYNETTAYERHRTTYNIFAIEYNLEFIKC